MTVIRLEPDQTEPTVEQVTQQVPDLIDPGFYRTVLEAAADKHASDAKTAIEGWSSPGHREAIGSMVHSAHHELTQAIKALSCTVTLSLSPAGGLVKAGRTRWLIRAVIAEPEIGWHVLSPLVGIFAQTMAKVSFVSSLEKEVSDLKEEMERHAAERAKLEPEDGEPTEEQATQIQDLTFEVERCDALIPLKEEEVQNIIGQLSANFVVQVMGKPGKNVNTFSDRQTLDSVNRHLYDTYYLERKVHLEAETPQPKRPPSKWPRRIAFTLLTVLSLGGVVGIGVYIKQIADAPKPKPFKIRPVPLNTNAHGRRFTFSAPFLEEHLSPSLLSKIRASKKRGPAWAQLRENVLRELARREAHIKVRNDLKERLNNQAYGFFLKQLHPDRVAAMRVPKKLVVFSVTNRFIEGLRDYYGTAELQIHDAVTGDKLPMQEDLVFIKRRYCDKPAARSLRAVLVVQAADGIPLYSAIYAGPTFSIPCR